MKFTLKTMFVLTALSMFAALPARAESAAPGEQVALLTAIDQHEIDAAKEAKSRELPEPVEQYADQMLQAHQQNLDETKSVSKAAGIKPEETSSVKTFKEQGDTKLDSMKKLDDAQFAERYTQEMIAGHKEALQKLDEFIKNSSGQLKDHFTKTRSHVQMHLEQAQALAKSGR